MKIRMKVEVSGTRNGQPWPARGAVVDVDDSEAAAMCAAGLATPVVDDKVETAVPAKEDVETRDPADQTPPDPAEVRAWAADNNVKVAAKGKVPDDIVTAYLEAKSGE